MDEIVVGLIPPVQNYQKQRDGARRALNPKRMIKDKRKNREDRRQSVRDGIVVTLSTAQERRQNADRRKP